MCIILTNTLVQEKEAELKQIQTENKKMVTEIQQRHEIEMIELREELTQSQVNNYKQILYKNCVMASGSKGIMAILAEWFKGLDLGLMR